MNNNDGYLSELDERIKQLKKDSRDILADISKLQKELKDSQKSLKNLKRKIEEKTSLFKDLQEQELSLIAELFDKQDDDFFKSIEEKEKNGK